MKLTVLGGGGVRIPLLINGLVAEGPGCPFDTVVLFDIEEDHLTTMGRLGQFLLEEAHSAIDLQYTMDIRHALSGADFVFSAIRVGQNASRVIDERVPLQYDVVGQETTGPGGFAMALRTIPEVLKYAAVIKEVAPKAWLLNFTNPAGLITQALLDHGGVPTIGICDSPEGIQHRIAKFLAVSSDEVELSYVGLNHLGWVTDVQVDGASRLSYLLDHYQDLSRNDAEFAAFDKDLVTRLGMLPNEYLYYYYYADDAVRHVQSVGETRGEQIDHLTQQLYLALHEALASNHVAQAWTQYTQAMGLRSQTYMQREMHATAETRADRMAAEESSAGYAGVALRTAQNILGHRTGPMILNTPNRGAISHLADCDVVEVPTLVTASGLHPLAVGALPQKVEGLLLSVKEYERLTVQAAVAGDYTLALEALAAHPLVPSFTTARKILEGYLKELAPWLPQFA